MKNSFDQIIPIPEKEHLTIELVRYPEITTFELASEEDTKRAADFKEIKQNLVEKIKDPLEKQDVNSMLGILDDYLTLPIIFDSFKTHSERREFKKRLEAVPGLMEHFQGNKLRKNKIGNVFSVFTVLEYTPDLVTPEEREQLAQLSAKLGQYDSYSQEEKTEYVRKITQLIRDYFSRLIKENSEESPAKVLL